MNISSIFHFLLFSNSLEFGLWFLWWKLLLGKWSWLKWLSFYSRTCDWGFQLVNQNDSIVQLFNRIQLFVTPCNTYQVYIHTWYIHTRFSCPSPSCPSPSPKLTSIESVIPSNHLILWHSLHLLLPIFPSIRVFSNDQNNQNDKRNIKANKRLYPYVCAYVCVNVHTYVWLMYICFSTCRPRT